MKNEEAIGIIIHQEQKVSNLKTYLIISFFLISIAALIIFISVVADYAGDKSSAIKILVTFIVYAVLLVAGYYYNQSLTKKLDRLDDQKQLLF